MGVLVRWLGITATDPGKHPFPLRKTGVDESLCEREPHDSQSSSDAWDTLSAQSRSLWYDGHFLVFNPNHKLYSLWWQLSVVLAYWNLFQVPFSVGFLDRRPPALDALVWAVDMFFLLDVFVTFCTPTTVKGRLIHSRRDIALIYLSFHFWIDISAAIPFDRIVASLAPSNPYVKLIALTRVLRMRRLFLLQKRLEKRVSINYEAVIIMKLLTMVAVMAHMEACLFWFVGSVQGEAGWMHALGVAEMVGDDAWRQYLASLYWAVTTFTTVGYGDFGPMNGAEEAFALIVMVINMGMAAYVIGNITILTTKVDQNTIAFRAKVSEVDSFLTTKDVPTDLRDMAIRQLETHQELLGETDEALQHCPPYIRNRILSHLYYDTLAKTPLLQGTSEDFIHAIAHAAVLDFFQPDTLLSRAGERSYSWYIVLSGSLAVQDGGQTVFRTVEHGGTFGAAGVFCGVRQNYDIRTKTMCRVLVVPYTALKAICAKYRPDHRLACKNLIARLKSLDPIHDTDKQQISETVQTVKSHLTTLKTDLVTKLCAASFVGDLPGIKALLLLDGDHDINEGDSSWRRPIHVAASAGHFHVMAHLIGMGADVNVADEWGCTPLDEAVDNMQSEVAGLLAQHGAKLKLKNMGEKLCQLVSEKNYDTLLLCLQHGANPNSTDYDLRTPLHIACADGLLAFVKLLVEFNARSDLKDRFGRTAAEDAQRHSGSVEILQALRKQAA